MLRNSLQYNPHFNWGAEKAAQDVVDVATKLVLALGAGLRQKLDLRLPIVRWLVRHAAFVETSYQVGHDGFTPWRRLTGKNWNGTVAELGEQVLGKLAFKRPSTYRKVKKGKRKASREKREGHLGCIVSVHGRAHNRAAERRSDSCPDNPQSPRGGPVGLRSCDGSPRTAKEASAAT